MFTCAKILKLSIKIFVISPGITKGFVDENFEWNFYTFVRPNQEQLRKIYN
jgi:hypothetical protein